MTTRDEAGAEVRHPLVVLVSAGSGVPSSTDMLLQAIAQQVKARFGEVRIETVSLRELAIDIAKGLVSNYVSPELQQAFDRVAASDALVVATPIYKATFSGLFKSFFDLLDKDALYLTPVLLAATGQSTRHALALDDGIRPLFAFMRALSVPTSIYATPGDWNNGASALHARIELAVAELGRLLPGAGGAGAVRDVEAGVADAQGGAAVHAPVDAPVRHADREQSVSGDDEIRLDTDLMRLATGGGAE